MRKYGVGATVADALPSPVKSVVLQIQCMTRVAALAQLRDERPEVGGTLGAAGAPGDLRRFRGALVEIREIRPHLGRGKGVGCGIAPRPGRPLIGCRREQV